MLFRYILLAALVGVGLRRVHPLRVPFWGVQKLQE